MLRPNFFSVALVLLAGALICRPAEEHARTPVLLELFTSEGCSSCPPADRLLGDLDQRQPIPGADLVVLSEHVDYWNHLGWRDPFSSPQFTARQQEYTNRYRLDGVYTPQLVVDGRFGLVGSDARKVTSVIQEAMREPKRAIAISNVKRGGNQVKARIEIQAAESAKAGRATLYVAIADDRAESKVARGENAGRSLAHVAVARLLNEVGAVDLKKGCSKEVTLPIRSGAGANGLRLVAFIQDPASGHVLGVAAREL